MSGRMDDASADAALLSRHLVGEVAPPEVLARFAAGCRALFPDAPAGADAALLAFVRRHPRTLPLLDAATALRAPGSALRARLLLMAAVLETTPRYADAFLPVDLPPLRLAWRLARDGTLAVLQALAGLALLPFVR
jgi:hypothetical protein